MRVRLLEQSLEERTRERDEARQERNNLLAIIHRDGGHHTSEVGITKSVADAHATWARVRRERDEFRARFHVENRHLRIENARVRVEVARLRAALEVVPHKWMEHEDRPEKLCGLLSVWRKRTPPGFVRFEDYEAAKWRTDCTCIVAKIRVALEGEQMEAVHIDDLDSPALR